MITVPFVAGTLIFAFIISVIFILVFYCKLEKNSNKLPTGLINTDIPIANGIDDIKIICM